MTGGFDLILVLPWQGRPTGFEAATAHLDMSPEFEKKDFGVRLVPDALASRRSAASEADLRGRDAFRQGNRACQTVFRGD